MQTLYFVQGEAAVWILKPGSPETLIAWLVSSPVLDLVCGPEYNYLYRPIFFLGGSWSVISHDIYIPYLVVVV